jgi:hypothetical protein
VDRPALLDELPDSVAEPVGVSEEQRPVDANDDHARRLDQPLVPLHIEVRI